MNIRLTLLVLMPFCFCFQQNTAKAQDVASAQSRAIATIFGSDVPDVPGLSFTGSVGANTPMQSFTGNGSSSANATGQVGAFNFGMGDSVTLFADSTASVNPIGGQGIGSSESVFTLLGTNNSAIEQSFEFDLGYTLTSDSSITGFLPLVDAEGRSGLSVTEEGNEILSVLNTSSIIGGEGLTVVTDSTTLAGTLLPGQSVNFEIELDSFSIATAIVGSGGDPAVPEPSSAVVIAIGALACFIKRRRSLC